MYMSMNVHACTHVSVPFAARTIAVDSCFFYLHYIKSSRLCFVRSLLFSPILFIRESLLRRLLNCPQIVDRCRMNRPVLSGFNGACLPLASSFLAPRSWLLNGSLCTTMRFLSTPHAPVVNLYKRLGVDPTATREEVKTAYRQRALECHPDVVDDCDKSHAEVKFRAISEAYDVLMDPQRRAEHDKVLGFDSIPQKPADACPSGMPAAAPDEGLAARKTSNGARRRKPFLRGDADRKFREAFNGMSLDQVIFKELLRKRMQHKRDDDKSPSGQEETFRRVAVDAAERVAAKIRRGYGPGMVPHIKLRVSVPHGPRSPPSDYMPFRPFHGWTVPEGVRTPAEPTLGCTSLVADDSEVQAPGVLENSFRVLPKHFPVVRALDGTIMDFNNALLHIEKERQCPHNMGKLYSYHRPY
uniref:Putative chaperone protein DNAj n=1 Tax=Trypanosoma vivax (strain Y486) TaxID=1055687 RepID=G0TWR8_TRYVY|nr:putative chaperone protein DNAj [Trypanosoma vivax Y486]